MATSQTIKKIRIIDQKNGGATEIRDIGADAGNIILENNNSVETEFSNVRTDISNARATFEIDNQMLVITPGSDPTS